MGAGVIDPDYQGEVKVVLFNHSPEPFQVLKRMRIAQLLVEKIANPEIKAVEKFARKTAREGEGFGSTGLSVLEELRVVQGAAEEVEEWADATHKPRTSPKQVKSVATRAAESPASSSSQAPSSGAPASVPKLKAATRELAEETGKATWASDAFRKRSELSLGHKNGWTDSSETICQVFCRGASSLPSCGISSSLSILAVLRTTRGAAWKPQGWDPSSTTRGIRTL